MGTQDFTNKESFSSQKGDFYLFFLCQSVLWYNHVFVQMCLLIETVSQVSNVAHGPFDLVSFNFMYFS